MKKNRQKSNQELFYLANKLNPAIEKIVINLGFNLLMLSFVNENNTNYLRLKIKHKEHSVSLTDCELVSRAVEKELDTKNLISFSYVLEVESPGVSDTTKEHYEFVLDKVGLTVKS